MSHILWWTDDLSLIEGLEYSLSRNGFTTDVKRTAKEALAALEKGSTTLFCWTLRCRTETAFSRTAKQVRQRSDVPIHLSDRFGRRR
jgi:DNA-binding response OmpR family regulator